MKFIKRQETNQLSAGAANLLMHINNRAGWIETFTVSASVLCSKANLTNSTFKRARTELRDKGYIFYESQGGNRAAKYSIVSEERSTMDHKPAPLLKQKEAKQITTTAAAEAIHFFQKNIGPTRPFIIDELIKWVTALGEPLVLAAMKHALERGKENWGYIKGILQACMDKGFTTINDAN